MIDLDRFPYFSLDCETTGLQFPVDQAFGVSIATPDGQSYYWDLREQPEVIDWLDRALPGYRGVIVAHNASFDYRMLKSAGITMNVRSLDDTVIRACCIDEHLHSYSLDSLSELYLGTGKVTAIYSDLAALYGGLATRNVQMARLHQAPSQLVAPYARKDAELTLALWKWQNDEVDRQRVGGVPDLHKIMTFERAVMPTLIGMEVSGIRVDTGLAGDAMNKLAIIIDRAESDLTRLVGRKVNVNSAPQIKSLFDLDQDNDGNWYADGVLIGTAKSGGPSLAAESLRYMAAAGNPASKLIMDIRSLTKTRDTFLGGHIIGHAHDGRVYPTINQSKGEHGGTGTGRLSIVNPAMQQIPSRNKEVAAIVKPIFLPELGQQWLDIDENSFEVRVFAHLVTPYDQGIAKQYADDPSTDFHQYVADLTHLPRNASYSGQANAKQLNLCLGSEMEYLAPDGWHKISQYAGGPVAQWDNGTVDFADPTAYHEGFSDDVYVASSKWGTVTATGDHRLPVWSPQKKGYTLVDRRIGEMSTVPRRNFSVVTNWEKHGPGIDWTDDEIRMAVAFQADGITSGGSTNTKGQAFVFKRERKITRMREMLLRMGLPFHESVLGSGCARFGIHKLVNNTGFHGKTFTYKWATKLFPEAWNIWDMSKHQKLVVLDEIRHWDGYGAQEVTGYSTGVKDNADFIQLLALSCGVETSLVTQKFDRDEWNDSFKLRIGIKNKRSLMSYNIKKTAPQPVFCFTVPSSYFLCRTPEGQVFVSGNSAIFNSGNGSLADKMGLPWEWDAFYDDDEELIKYRKAGPDAMDIINRYHQALPGVKKLQNKCRTTALDRGFLFTGAGRRIRFPDKRKAYKASGLLIQSTAADINKDNILIADHYLRANGGRLLLNTHDSYSMSIPDGSYQDLWPGLKALLDAPGRARVPLIAEVSGVGSNWWAALNNQAG